MLIASTPEGARDFVVPSRLVAGRVLRAAAEPAAVQAAAHGRRARPLLPDRALPARRGPARRPPVRVHAARRRDELRRRRRRDGGDRRGRARRAIEAVDRRAGPGGRAPDVARGDGALRHRQARPALRPRARRRERGVRGDRVPRLPGRRGEGDLRARARATSAATGSTRSSSARSSSAPPGLVWMRVSGAAARSSRRWRSSCPRPSSIGLVDATGAEAGDLLLLAAGERAGSSTTCSARSASTSAGHRSTRAGCDFVWVVDFPLFEAIDDDGRPIPAHHPFTMPHPDDLELLDARHGRGAARACARSPTTSCSTAGSSARAACGSTARPAGADLLAARHRRRDDAQARFGFLLDAFRYGAPPHAGFAFGIDRLVAILAGEDNIREVIAFPKTQSGADPLTGAPTPDRRRAAHASSACR